jgi:hypothetical protein
LFIPGGIFELAFPVWLIVKGFTSTTPAADRHGLATSSPVPVPV